jgi:predicted permease
VNYYGEIQRRVSQLPGVREAAFVSLLPLQSWGWNGDFAIDGRPEEPASRKPQAELRTISPNYFHAMGIPIRQGRAFTERDTADAPRVVIINEALARRYFPGENPIGKYISREFKLEIVGVSADVRQVGLDRAALPEIFHPIAQRKSFVWLAGMTLIVATQTAPENFVSAVREAIRQIDPTQALFNINSMDKVVSNSLSNQSLYTWLLGLFAALALVLAVAGIYGVISYAVTRRTREFGIRIALGAPGARVLRMVLARGGVLVAIGLAAGIAGALALTRLLGTLLGQISSTDPLTFAAVAIILATVALGACYVPARRATRVDPVVALRQE